jgi:hypothetical protein
VAPTPRAGSLVESWRHAGSISGAQPPSKFTSRVMEIRWVVFRFYPPENRGFSQIQSCFSKEFPKGRPNLTVSYRTPFSSFYHPPSSLRRLRFLPLGLTTPPSLLIVALFLPRYASLPPLGAIQISRVERSGPLGFVSM